METAAVDMSTGVEGSEVGSEDTPQVNPTDYRSQKHKVKIEGREQEIAYDELVKGYQLEKTAQKRLQEAAEYRKQVQSDLDKMSRYERLMEEMTTNPELLWQVAEQLGHNPKALAARLVEREYELAKMTPEQRKLRHYEEMEMQQKAAQEKAQRAQEEAEAKQYHDYACQQYAQTIDAEVGEILSTGQQISRREFERALEHIQRHLHVNGKPMPFKQAFSYARREIEDERRDLLQTLDPDQIPKEVRERLRKAELARLKKFPQTGVNRGEPSMKPSQKVEAKDFFDSLEKKYNRK